MTKYHARAGWLPTAHHFLALLDDPPPPSDALKGTYHFYYRTRAVTPGSYIQPSAKAEAIYDGAVFGQSAGGRVNVGAAEGQP